MAKFGINDILNAKTKAAGQQAQGYKEIYLSPYEVKAAEENTHQKLEGIEELADSFLHVGQEQPTVLAIDYLNITIFDVQEMPIDLYLYFMREANIHKLMQTKEGREYLDNCWRMEQTKPDRKKLREKMRKGER